MLAQKMPPMSPEKSTLQATTIRRRWAITNMLETLPAFAGSDPTIGCQLSIGTAAPTWVSMMTGTDRTPAWSYWRVHPAKMTRAIGAEREAHRVGVVPTVAELKLGTVVCDHPYAAALGGDRECLGVFELEDVCDVT